jgi:hypothetical protein
MPIVLATASPRPMSTKTPSVRYRNGFTLPVPIDAATLRATRRPWRIACCAVGGDGLSSLRGIGHAAASPIAQTFVDAVDAHRAVGDDPPAAVERQAEVRDHRVRPHARRPRERARRDDLAVAEPRGGLRHLLERRARADLDAAPVQLARRELRQRRLDLGITRSCASTRIQRIPACGSADRAR